MTSTVLYACGDVVVDRDDPGSAFTHVAPLLRRGDFTFCQVETVYSLRGQPIVTPGRPLHADPRNIKGLSEAGLQVISIAGNHCMDYGAEGLLDMIANLRSAGLKPIGAGENLVASRAPAILESKGTRVAFLAYTSILPFGTWATERRAGCAPLRVCTHYDPYEPHQPGCPARIRTFAEPGDLSAIQADIAAARAHADYVMVSLHWGLHFTPHKLAEYEPVVAHALIDAGADGIIGTHPHHLKGMEVYRGKPVAYSLGNFTFDMRVKGDAVSTARQVELSEMYPLLAEAPQDSMFPFPDLSRLTLIMRVRFGRDGLATSYLPARINAAGQPELLPLDHRYTREIVDFLTPDCRALGMDLKCEEDALVVEPRAATGPA